MRAGMFGFCSAGLSSIRFDLTVVLGLSGNDVFEER